MKHYLLPILILFVSFSSCKNEQQTKSQNLNIMTYNIRLDVASDGENAWTNRKEFLSSQDVFRLNTPIVLRSESAVVALASKILL